MSTFKEAGRRLTIRWEERDDAGTVVSEGLRKTQVAAAYAGAAHALHSTLPATVAMPTGSGKSAVMILIAMLIQARRVLMIVSSDRLRSEIAEKFQNYDPFLRLGLLPNEAPRPKVQKVTSRPKSEDAWSMHKNSDVIVGLPATLSPGFKDVVQPPEDFFDLMLIDEGHHAPASTWVKLIDSLPNIPKILFTATPYRLDKRPLPGRIIHSYSARNAYDDGVFGKVEYFAVNPIDGQNADEAIRDAVIERYQYDRSNGFDHRFLVKAHSIPRAKQLSQLYSAVGARVDVVASSNSQKSNDEKVAHLRTGELEGLVCVRMLGEGFDEPRLKIAALHDVDKSLPITLQFIGRFARTTEAHIGQASFFSSPQDTHIDQDLRQLYMKDAVWEEIVIGHADKAIDAETTVEDLRYRLWHSGRVFAQYPLSEQLWEDLRPRQKAYVFDCRNRNVDVRDLESAFAETQCIYLNEIPELAIIVEADSRQPSWTIGDSILLHLANLYVAYFSERHQLLFFHCSSRGQTKMTECLKAIGAEPRVPVAFEDLSRVFGETPKLAPFNVGLRTRVYADGVESYRSSMGKSAGDAFGPSDALRYHRGYCAAKIDADQVLGMSESSKLWGGENVSITEFVKWCGQLGDRIRSDTEMEGRRGYFSMPFVQPMQSIPRGIVGGDWDEIIYRKNVALTLVPPGPGRIPQSEIVYLRDTSLKTDFRERESGRMTIRLDAGVFESALVFRPGSNQVFSPTSQETHDAFVNAKDLYIKWGNVHEPFLNFLGQHPPTLFSIHGGLIRGKEGLPERETMAVEPPEDIIEGWDWTGVDVRREALTREAQNGLLSIQDRVLQHLEDQGADVVFHDDGSGELADLISIRSGSSNAIEEGEVGEIDISLYHCKYSSADDPGARVKDLYELAGQAIKSGRRLAFGEIYSHIDRRLATRGDESYLIGNHELLGDLLSGAIHRVYSYEVIIVQPGIRHTGMSEPILQILARLSESIEHGGLNKFKCICWGEPS